MIVRPRSHVRSLAPLLALSVLVSLVPPANAAAPPPGSERWPHPETRAAFGAHAMVASNSALASEAGLEILRAGGNAVDAAVAVGFALAVTYPYAGNLGGGGFMVVRMADGRAAALDYREVAPLAATRDMYVDPAGKLTDRSVEGHLASGVPGSVAGLDAALRRFGTLPLARVLEPAIRLAAEGFVVDSALSASLAENGDRLRRFAGRDLFFPGGRVLAPGERLVQPDLARTLALIAAQGPKAFYDGPVAEALVAEMERGGGILTREDLRRYRPVWREPLVGTYRGHTLLAMPPPSSGGVTLIESLNILKALGALPAFGSPARAHRLAEAFRRAFVDRNEKLGDPDAVAVPVRELTSKRYARRLARGVDLARAAATPRFDPKPEGTHTTHFSVVDSAGNAVATTTTINDGYGSGVWIPGGGFLMNDEMDDFSTQPGTPNLYGLVQGEANAIAPGKRMLSSMSPTIVLDPKGRVLMVLGAAGGPRIITVTAQVILNVVEHRMTLADALRAPRMHHQSLPDEIRVGRGEFDEATLAGLRAMGHRIVERDELANVNAILRVPGGWHGVREPRSVGGAIGY